MKKIIILLVLFTLIFTGCVSTKLEVTTELPGELIVNTNPIPIDVAPIEETTETVETEEIVIDVSGEQSIEDQLKDISEKYADLSMYKYITLEEFETLKKDKASFLIVYSSVFCDVCDLFKANIFQYVNSDQHLPLYILEVSVTNPDAQAWFKTSGFEGTPTTQKFIDGKAVGSKVGFMDLEDLENFAR